MSPVPAQNEANAQARTAVTRIRPRAFCFRAAFGAQSQSVVRERNSTRISEEFVPGDGHAWPRSMAGGKFRHSVRCGG
eukprot:3440157-Prymnesium_polylepis.1